MHLAETVAAVCGGDFSRWRDIQNDPAPNREPAHAAF
jgi:hypothetical protein